MAEFADSCFPFEFVAHSKALRLGEWPCLWHLGLTLASPGLESRDGHAQCFGGCEATGLQCSTSSDRQLSNSLACPNVSHCQNPEAPSLIFTWCWWLLCRCFVALGACSAFLF